MSQTAATISTKSAAVAAVAKHHGHRHRHTTLQPFSLDVFQGSFTLVEGSEASGAGLPCMHTVKVFRRGARFQRMSKPRSHWTVLDRCKCVVPKQ